MGYVGSARGWCVLLGLALTVGLMICVLPFDLPPGDGTGTAQITATVPRPTDALSETPGAPQSDPSPTAAPHATETEALDVCHDTHPVGLGLRLETQDLLLAYAGCRGLTMTSTPRLAEIVFPELNPRNNPRPDNSDDAGNAGWIRLLGAPSLEALAQKAQRAQETGLVYEGLAYGLETSNATPDEEWQDLIGSTNQARIIADQVGVQLVMAPGFRLMSNNEEAYGPMAELTEIWMLQTQQLQRYPAGPVYREKVAAIVEQLREANPDIAVWAQINLLPHQATDAATWLAYRESIIDIVDGCYIGVYIWDTEDPEILFETISDIFAAAYGSVP